MTASDEEIIYTTKDFLSPMVDRCFTFIKDDDYLNAKLHIDILIDACIRATLKHVKAKYE